jgi:hypothetical protein
MIVDDDLAERASYLERHRGQHRERANPRDLVDSDVRPRRVRDRDRLIECDRQPSHVDAVTALSARIQKRDREVRHGGSIP